MDRRREMDRQRLAQAHVQLVQYGDLFRQRRALRELGHEPNLALVRPTQIVEYYEQ